MKNALLLAFVGFAVFAKAADSPEVLFVANLGKGQINRFDPISGASFGAFGAGIISYPMGVAHDANGIVYVSDNIGTTSVIRKFNGFTGNYLGQLGPTRSDILGGLHIGPDGYLYGSVTINSIGSSGGIIKVDRNTGTTLYLALTGSVNPTDVCYGVSQIFVSAQNGTYGVNPVNFTQGTFNSTLAGTTFLNFDQNRANWFAGGVGGQWNLGTQRGTVHNFAGASLGASSGVSIGDLTNGHDLMYASVKDGSGNWFVQRYDVLNKQFLGTFGALGAGNSYGAMTCYTAPEPASLFALGCGAALIAIRRRKNSK